MIDHFPGRPMSADEARASIRQLLAPRPEPASGVVPGLELADVARVRDPELRGLLLASLILLRATDGPRTPDELAEAIRAQFPEYAERLDWILEAAKLNPEPLPLTPAQAEREGLDSLVRLRVFQARRELEEIGAFLEDCGPDHPHRAEQQTRFSALLVAVRELERYSPRAASLNWGAVLRRERQAARMPRMAIDQLRARRERATTNRSA